MGAVHCDPTKGECYAVHPCYNPVSFFLYFFFKSLFIHERHRERQRHKGEEKQASCEEPDVGLDPRAPGSYREPKADPQLLNYPGIPCP